MQINRRNLIMLGVGAAVSALVRRFWPTKPQPEYPKFVFGGSRHGWISSDIVFGDTEASRLGRALPDPRMSCSYPIERNGEVIYLKCGSCSPQAADDAYLDHLAQAWADVPHPGGLGGLSNEAFHAAVLIEMEDWADLTEWFAQTDRSQKLTIEYSNERTFWSAGPEWKDKKG